MLVLAEEVHAFEDENDMVRRVASGPGAATPYDWEGMNVALITRIHDQGLPPTQAQLIAEMQDWFADQTDGERIPDGRSIRRRVTPVWKALRRDHGITAALIALIGGIIALIAAITRKVLTNEALLARLDRELVAERERLDRQRAEDRKSQDDRLARIETDIRAMRDMLLDAFQRGWPD